MHSLEQLQQSLVFLHNARCGGNKLNTLFMLQYQEQHWFKLGQNKDPAPDTSYDDLIAAAKTEQYKLYLGHIVFGLHQHFSSPIEYISNFRDPIKRTISLYTRWLTPADTGTSLPDFLTTDFEANNGMVKRLAGIGEYQGKYYDFVANKFIEPIAQVDQAIYERALANLEQYVPNLILLEQLNASCIMLEQKFKLPPLFSITYNHLNQSDTNLKATPQTIPPAWLAWIEQNNDYDLKLYQHVKKRFEQQKQTLSAEQHEQIRYRTLLTDCLRYEGKNNITLQDFFQQLAYLLGRLHAFGLIEDIFQVLKLVFSHHEITKYSLESLLAQLTTTLNKTQLDALQALLNAR